MQVIFRFICTREYTMQAMGYMKYAMRDDTNWRKKWFIDKNCFIIFWVKIFENKCLEMLKNL